MKYFTKIIIALSVLYGVSLEASLQKGSHSFNFPVPQTGKNMEVYTYVPENANTKTPIVFVLAGLNRNADNYRNSWVENAEKNNLIVIAPKFSEQDYPGVDGYNLGNLFDSKTKQAKPKSEWAFTVIDAIFTQLQTNKETENQQYYLFGHSAGCQFVHRMLTFVPEAKVKAAICSAAGWWTLPDTETEWPYGLDFAPVNITEKSLAPYFAMQMLITVGENDNDPYHPLLRRNYQAMAQGGSRVSRAFNYFKTAEQKSKRFKLKFNWIYTTLANTGHQGDKMSAYGAQQFAYFEKKHSFMN